MKQIFTAVLLSCCFVAVTSCEDVKIEDKDEYEFGDVGSYIEIEYVDGEFRPKSEPIGQELFDAMFQGTWTLDRIYTVGRTGKLTEEEKLIGISYPCFGVKSGGRLRQYIESPATLERTYKDGSYLYDPQTGLLNFVDVVEEHPDFRVVNLKETEMSGTFIGENNDYDQSVLTLYVYRRLSPLDEVGIDQLYGAE